MEPLHLIEAVMMFLSCLHTKRLFNRVLIKKTWTFGKNLRNYGSYCFNKDEKSYFFSSSTVDLLKYKGI